jgi:CRISPR-associated protein Csb2
MLLCITVRWLDERYHGILDREGPPEWPPSPFRLFQALVAGVAQHGKLDSKVGQALRWLVKYAPLIVAPRSCEGHVVTRFVPNNDSDEVPDRQGRLTGKTSRPTIFLDAPEIHYLWPIPDGETPPLDSLVEGSHCLTCFGWGIDMAFGHALLMQPTDVAKLKGVRWYPKPGTFREDGSLRVPTEESMEDLRKAHLSTLGRIEGGKRLKAVHKPQEFDHVFYTSSERPLGRPYAAFALRDGQDEVYRYPHAKLVHIAAMTRNAAIKAMKGYPPVGCEQVWVEAFVAGHRNGEENHEQFSYIPIPSIGHEQADAMIRRVMIIAPFGRDAELRHLAEQLDGEQLQREHADDGPFLSRMRTDRVVRRYTTPSRRWASVTPVILPGHDDHKPAKLMKLIERALEQGGVEQSCRFTGSSMPNFANCLTAHKYDASSRRTGYYRPDYLESMTAVHVRLIFDNPVAGPLCLGAGRHCGFGVLAGLPEAGL